MKVGDLVERDNDLVRESVGRGIILDSYESDEGVVYFEVQWFKDDRMWYDTLELKVISEGM